MRLSAGKYLRRGRGIKKEKGFVSCTSYSFHCNYCTTSSNYKMDRFRKIIISYVCNRVHSWPLDTYLYL